MRTPGPSQAPATAWPRCRPPTTLPRAVGTVVRWGLLAGVTSILGNVLLVVKFLTPAGSAEIVPTRLTGGGLNA